ncbi:MAG: serine/threonine protein kinase, partial [Verrucomicrobiota bacterium]|nr:serine/threonine protein kinase [Verrucomicrobiota bacterium]
MQNPANLCPRCQSPIPADAPGGICPGCALLAAANPSEAMPGALGGAPTLEEVAAAFPELEVLQLIGHGGMGVVFQARQPRLDRRVALKILPRNLAAQPGFAERFTREARALARLAHPNIVTVYDFGESGGFFYLLMEFVDGVNLRDAIRAGVTPEQALALVPKLCEALQFAHDKGVLHRDIKPENILLDTGGAVKLVDFGIAKLAGDAASGRGLTVSGSVLGTAAYMAPEQLEKPGSVDHRADIYSLGVVFYEMLTGELPIGRFAAPSEKSAVNRGVDEVVFRALEKERERRQQSATEMRTQVEGLGANAPRPAADPGALARAQTGHKLARAGIWLTLAPLGLFLLAAPWIWKTARAFSSPELMFQQHWPVLLAIAIPAALAGLGGIVATLTALLGYRFRAPWFFWFLVLLATAVVLVFNVVSVPGVLALGILGYCLFYHREFFAHLPAPPALSSVGENVWPRRVFWLLLLLIVLPLLFVVLGLAWPMLARTHTAR